MYRIFVLLVMSADKGVVEGVQALDLCHRLCQWTYGLIMCMLACMLFSPNLDKNSQMYFPQRPCTYFISDLT